MTSIEERLARDIEAVTRGVNVTQSDVERAREQVEGRIEQSRGRTRRRWTLAVAVAATAVVVAGVGGVVLSAEPGLGEDPAPADSGSDPDPLDSFLQGAESPPTQETVEGVWRVDNGMTLVSFTADGAVAIDTRGQITDAELSGAYTLDGDQIVMDLRGNGVRGCAGEVSFRASVRGPGEMRMVIDEPADAAACAFEQSGWWVLEHLLPTRDGYDRFGPPEKGDYGPLRRSVLPGFWLVAGGGYGVQLRPVGSYSVLDDSGLVVDNGQWQLDGDELVLEGDTGCRVALSGVQHINPGTDMIRGTLTEYVCEMAWVSGDGGSTMGWFQIPDRSSS